MEIEFNTGRIPQPESSHQAARRAAAPVASAQVSLSTLDSLKNQLDTLPTTRPDAVAKAKQLIANGDYPPDYVLNRVAVLLAINAKNNSTDQTSQTGQTS